MKKYFFACLIFTGIIFAQTENPFDPLIFENSRKDILNNAQWSLRAVEIESGKILINKNPDMSLAPASGLKLITTAAAIELLGSDFKYTTRLYYDGDIINGILNGSIYIAGSGDPTLASTVAEGVMDLDLLMKKWVDSIKDLGINSINGDIVADESIFGESRIPDNWYWIDIGNYYGAQSSGLTIHDNLYFLTFKPGDKVGDPAEVLNVSPVIDSLAFTNHMKTGKKGSGDNGYIYAAPGQFNAVLRGTVPAGVSEFTIKGAIPNPPLFAAQYLRKTLFENNIVVRGNSIVITSPKNYDAQKIIDTVVSPPLKEIVYIINKRSNNLFTEQILRTLAVEKGNGSGVYDGIEVIYDYLNKCKIATDGFKLDDGCGLSRSNMITTKIMTELLVHMTKSKYFDDYYNSLSVAGDPNDIGFFSNFGKGTELQFNARIKSGYIERVRSHSGYLRNKSGKLIAFSFIANNYEGSSRQIDEIHKDLLIQLAKLK